MKNLRVALLILAAAAGARAQARDIPNPAPSGSGQSYLATSSDGRIYLSWIEAAGAAHRLQFAVWEKESWKLLGSVAEGPRWVVNWADYPTFLPLPGGAFAAHWLERTGSAKYTYGIKIADSVDSSSWKVRFAPEVKEEGQYTGFVSLVALAKGMGAAYLAPGSSKGGHSAGHEEEDKSLRFVRFGAGGAVVSDDEIDSDVCTCCQTAAVLTDDGPIVAYRDHEAGEIRDISLVLFRNGKWSAPRNLNRDGWKINGCPVNGPALAASGRRVAAAWYTEAESKPKVQLAMSTDVGASFGAPLRLDDGAPLGRVAVLLLPDGGAVASWIEKKTSGAEIRIRRVNPDGRLGAPNVVSAVEPGRKTGFPKIALSGPKILATWTADRVRTVALDVPPR